MSNEKMMLRIKKMMALANDAGATEHEREAALEHATALLQKYNLTMKDLPADEQDEKRSTLEMTISGDVWIRSLAQSVASLFFCDYFYMRTGTSGKDTHHFVGREGNAITAMEMTNFLSKSIRKEATSRYRSATSPEGRSFCVGALVSISRRIKEMKTQGTKSADGSSNALALLDLYKSESLANAKFLETTGVKVVQKNVRKSSIIGSSYDAGKVHGNSISLTNQIGGSRAKHTMIGG
jgi:hypothetical protein